MIKENCNYCFADVVMECLNMPDVGYRNLDIFKTESEKPDYFCNFEVVDEIPMPNMSCTYSNSFDKWFIEDDNKWCAIFQDGDHRTFARTTYKNGNYSIELKKEFVKNIGANSLLHVMDLPQMLLGYDAAFLHSSYVIYKNNAILFTADKQVGKSTQAELWRKYKGAFVANGDRCLLRKRGCTWFAHGTPFCGTSNICENISSPISAVVILGQSSQNTIRRANTKEAVSSLLSGMTFSTWDKKSIEKTLMLCEDIVSSVPFYKLDCVPEKSAADLLYETIL